MRLAIVSPELTSMGVSRGTPSLPYLLFVVQTHWFTFAFLSPVYLVQSNLQAGLVSIGCDH